MMKIQMMSKEKECVTLQDEMDSQVVVVDRGIEVADQSDFEALKTLQRWSSSTFPCYWIVATCYHWFTMFSTSLRLIPSSSCAQDRSCISTGSLRFNLSCL